MLRNAVIPVALLFITFVCVHGNDEESVSKITKAGGRATRNDQGRICRVVFGPSRTSFAGDKDFEAIDFGALPDLKSVSILGSGQLTRRFIAHLHTIPAGLESLQIIGMELTDNDIAKLLQKHQAVGLCRPGAGTRRHPRHMAAELYWHLRR